MYTQTSTEFTKYHILFSIDLPMRHLNQYTQSIVPTNKTSDSQ